jgi:hypothetical protein
VAEATKAAAVGQIKNLLMARQQQDELDRQAAVAEVMAPADADGRGIMGAEAAPPNPPPAWSGAKLGTPAAIQGPPPSAEKVVALNQASQPARPTLTITEINKRLELAVNAALLHRLGFVPEKVGTAMLYQDSAFPAIADAVGAHCAARAQVFRASKS